MASDPPSARSKPGNVQGLTGEAPQPRANRVLAGLAPSAIRIGSDLTLLHFVQRQVIWRPNDPVEAVLFPVGAAISVLAHGAEREVVEISIVGNEGVVGLPAFLGGGSSPTTALVQLGGPAYRMPVAVFRREVEREPAFRQRVQHYAQAYLTNAGQSCLCHRMHRADNRLARWLLTCQDCVGSSDFSFTQEFMAQMLGVRRATVSVICSALQRSGLIRCTPGRVTVVNRRRLEAAACPCYHIVRRELDRLLGPAPA
jgi:CRP-like cAMP-binding protein